tara:strand:- start:756 stop:1190 length:435 start_codon:yes stop_codon:yes gene_type:complete
MTPKAQRSIAIFSIILVFTITTFLVLNALKDSIVFFYSPTETLEKFKYKENQNKIRIGGLVVKNSLYQNNSIVKFEVTDQKNKINVTYDGILPDLFREGQGVVIEGYFKKGLLQATEILAKHDENYMPKEVADILKKEGNWKGN